MKNYSKKIIYTTSPDNLTRFLTEWEAEEDVKIGKFNTIIKDSEIVGTCHLFDNQSSITVVITFFNKLKINIGVN